MQSLGDLPREYLGKASKMLLAQTDTLHQDQEILLRDQRNRQREHQRKLLGLPEAASEGDEMRIVADNITITQPPPQPPPAPVSPVRQGMGLLAKTAIAAALLGSGGAAAVAGKYVIDHWPDTETVREGVVVEIGNAATGGPGSSPATP